MDKISGILPSSPRIQSVDIENSQPIRPGVPAFGRKEGSTASMRDRVSFSQQARELANQSVETIRNPRDLSKTAIANSMAKNFFDTRLKPGPSAQSAAASASPGISSGQGSSVPEIESEFEPEQLDPKAEFAGIELAQAPSEGRISLEGF